VARKKRNYRAEYKRRIERALQKGYSRSVARGHPKIKTITVDYSGVKRKKRVVVEVGLKGAKYLGVRPGTDFQKLIQADAKHVFGEIPKRREIDSDSPRYQLRLEELQKRGGVFDWTNEQNFIAEMQAAGLTERDAYTQWFSPEG
jgi:hypothetical protein